MSDRVFFSLATLLAVLLIALSAVTPQGLGARAPGLFGHPPDQQQAGANDRAALERAVAAKTAAALAGLRSSK